MYTKEEIKKYTKILNSQQPSIDNRNKCKNCGDSNFLLNMVNTYVRIVDL